ncbi:WhiB family transcriptional regulator [Streptomyces sp. JNUCC 64]
MVATVHRARLTPNAAAGSAAVPAPCQRRPDVFRHPLLENPPVGSTDLPIQTRRLQALEHAARQLCSSCPVRQECLREAVLQADPGGYAAATTRQDRRLIRQRLGVGTPQGDLAVPVDLRHRNPEELDAVLGVLAPVRSTRPDRPGLLPVIPSQKTHPPSEVSMTAPAGDRISFPFDDPVRAVREAVLAPLLRAARPTLEAAVQLGAMLAHAPSAGLTPAFLDTCREALRRLTAWDAGTGGDAPATDGGLTGSVSVELATSDPITALRQEVFEPLLRRLLASIDRVEEVMPVLVNAPGRNGDPRAADLAGLRAALRALAEQIAAYGSVGAPRSPSAPPVGADPHEPFRPARPEPVRSPGPGGHVRAVPVARGSVEPSVGGVVRVLRPPTSLRRAVERTVASFPGPFTVRDVLLALPPEVFQESGKSVSNVLSAMVKSGRLLRVSRGTYTSAAPAPSGDGTVPRS